MVSRKKQALPLTCSNPLQQAGVLEVVLSYLGDEGVFVQTVSKMWRALHTKLITEKASSEGSAQATSYTSVKAIFASAARLKLAVAYGLQLANVQRYAGRHADIDMLRVAFKLGLPRAEDVASSAAESADLSKLIWLRTKQRCRFPSNITATAAAAGSLQMLQWLKKKRCRVDKETSSAAASRPCNIPVLQYLHENGCEWHEGCCGRAGATGDVAQLQWLCDHGAPLTTYSAIAAASGGSVPVFEFMLQQGVHFNSDTMQRAAECGKLQLCQWLRTTANCE
jgi:hypothetical protein